MAFEGRVPRKCDSRSVTHCGGGCGTSPVSGDGTAAMTSNAAKEKAARAYQPWAFFTRVGAAEKGPGCARAWHDTL